MNAQLILDRAAIGLSLLCAVHCFLFPVALVLFSSFVPLSLDAELVHKWLLIVTIPVSLFALTLGCRAHRRYHLYFFAAVGLSFLGAASYLGHDQLGELGEKLMNALGGMAIAIGHYLNYRLCQSEGCCPSAQESSNDLDSREEFSRTSGAGKQWRL